MISDGCFGRVLILCQKLSNIIRFNFERMLHKYDNLIDFATN